MEWARIAAFLLLSACVGAQTPSASVPPAASVKQLMLDLIHPASNDLLLLVFRGGPSGEKEWAAVRHNALVLAESGRLLAARAPARDSGDWAKDSRLLQEAGAAAYQAAQAKDPNALTAIAGALDASCTACHKQYRPNVFPGQGGQK